ncbi:hypothetical protein [Paeniglutamicibacter cryotolerans]|uniref:Uncharacterized protein n=1 Tax=Paeniglutamicibacter cryotolerans TaxID=670079 RepID=A0A839QHS3_9MICC|nr:hypothetical protein [Paeniglutamicibacter cryotolerans]MBB2995430.1 hypothetical protein [Paeniglutamicibacter cryotolerans]
MSKPRNKKNTARPALRAAPAPVVNQSTQRTPEQARGNGNVIVLAAVGATILLFWYFHLLVLNQMSDLSGGLAMPDQMMGGYSVADIEALRAAMNSDAIGQLNYVHKTAGMLFPLFLALTTMLVVNLHTVRGPVRWVLWAVPMLFAIVDLWENAAIDALFNGPLDPGAVSLASTLTTISWVLLFATAAVLVGVLIASFITTFKAKWSEAGLS